MNMPYKDKEKDREYHNAWYQAHKDENNARSKAWYQAHNEEQKAYKKAWRLSHKEELKAYNKTWYQTHKDERKAKVKAWRQEHKEERKAYQKSDTNSLGQTKQSIRKMSNQYLFNTLKHTKLKGYEIHHCFGYDDYHNFIYIPKSLHLKIHQFLRDNNIDADTDHYNKIVHLIIACEEYVYIKA